MRDVWNHNVLKVARKKIEIEEKAKEVEEKLKLVAEAPFGNVQLINSCA